MQEKFQKIPDGKGGFKLVKSEMGTYTKDDLQKEEAEKKEVREKAIKSNKNKSLIGWSVLFIIFGSCWYAFNDISNNSPTIDPAKVLSPQERKDICYELYDTPEERAALLTCIARVNSDS